MIARSGRRGNRPRPGRTSGSSSPWLRQGRLCAGKKARRRRRGLGRGGGHGETVILAHVSAYNDMFGKRILAELAGRTPGTKFGCASGTRRREDPPRRVVLFKARGVGRPAARACLGKAVKIGHSCAAVTRHRPPLHVDVVRARPIGCQPVKAEARKPADPAGNAESEHPALGRSRARCATARGAPTKSSSHQ